ncbi:hypothetical protein TNCT_273861 [Trichonephila clavata]|nr:hypothetical protein TNCT_483472 [Trichonephila clavata]GFR07623.1 hypothetical protein TNCT_273861 [Trichonephila clavata]
MFGFPSTARRDAPACAPPHCPFPSGEETKTKKFYRKRPSCGGRDENCRIVQLRAVDHSARGSMKNAASCEIWCELQNTQITDYSNAHCGSRSSAGASPV